MKPLLLSLVGALLVCGTGSLYAQNSYAQTNLVANVAGVASHTDSQLSNPWGIAFIPGNPFWISNNNSGVLTLYDAQGNKQSTVVGIPGAANNPCSPGCPTGIVANSSSAFGGAAFLFDTEDGIVARWTGVPNASIVFDNSYSGAVYKGLATISNGSGTFLLAANFNSGNIDVLDSNFNLTNLMGSFTDPNLPSGYAPHGVHVINNQVYVAYALQDAAQHDPVTTPGSGVIDIFDANGNFLRTLTSGGTLNAPWGVMMAPPNFGAFANDILVGNFGDGTINAFDPGSGSFLGQLTDTNGNMIVNPGLWDMVTGQGGTGDPNTLYFTAGGSNQTQGLFAALVPSAVVVNGTGFSLSVSPSSLVVSAGGSGSVTVSAAAIGGFGAPISLSCSGLPAQMSCTFSPATITPGSSSSSAMTVSVASTYTASAMGMITGTSLFVGLLGFVAFGEGSLLSGMARRWKWMLGLLVMSLALLLSIACSGVAGSSGTSATNGNNGTTGNNVTMMVIGTSGAISQSVPVTLTVQ